MTLFSLDANLGERFIQMKRTIFAAPVAQKDGHLVMKSFPMDEGMYKAILSLPFHKQVIYFTDEYRFFKKENNYQNRHPFASLEAEDPDVGKAHEVPDEALNPQEYCLEKEKCEFLYQAISHLNPKQRRIVVAIYYEEMTQQDIADELGMTLNTLNHNLQRALAKLRKELEGKI